MSSLLDANAPYTNRTNMQTLGNLEEMVLLVVASLDRAAYGVSVTDEYNRISHNNISLSAIHTVLRRLENKGFINSVMGGASAERGGRRKRLYQINKSGYEMVEQVQMNRQEIWARIPKFEF